MSNLYLYVWLGVESPGDLFCLWFDKKHSKNSTVLKLAERLIGNKMITEEDQHIQRRRTKTSGSVRIQTHLANTFEKKVKLIFLSTLIFYRKFRKFLVQC